MLHDSLNIVTTEKAAQGHLQIEYCANFNVTGNVHECGGDSVGGGGQALPTYILARSLLRRQVKIKNGCCVYLYVHALPLGFMAEQVKNAHESSS